jgi:hypothetical protein
MWQIPFALRYEPEHGPGSNMNGLALRVNMRGILPSTVALSASLLDIEAEKIL